LFTGDAERDAENAILENGVDISCDLLKVGHHGSETSTSYRFLREVAPTYGVISVGVGNSYGHPHEEPLSRLRDADVKLYRTDLQGDVICKSDGVNLTFTTAKNSGAITNPTDPDRTESDTAAVTEYTYIGNVSSKKFHAPDCKSLPDESNRIWFTTREEAVSAGYSPCGNCDP
jgi:competence protein ComEC